MPARDGTGPFGEGPLTGRGLGPCGRGVAFRRGYGRRLSRRAFNQIDERQLLEEELSELEKEKESLKKRLDEMN